jgi:hypothetical protein
VSTACANPIVFAASFSFSILKLAPIAPFPFLLHLIVLHAVARVEFDCSYWRKSVLEALCKEKTAWCANMLMNTNGCHRDFSPFAKMLKRETSIACSVIATRDASGLARKLAINQYPKS